MSAVQIFMFIAGLIIAAAGAAYTCRDRIRAGQPRPAGTDRRRRPRERRTRPARRAHQ